MMKKKKRSAVVEASIEEDAKELNLRKASFIRATQSDRITVLVGPSQISFQVPQDLLVQLSPALGKMCQSGFHESQVRLIKLPDVMTSTFEDFFIWIHAYEPSVDPKSFASVLDLAIFAEIYMICQLKNQTSDILRKELGNGRWQLTPDDVSKVYGEVPQYAILRQLCSVSLSLAIQDPPSPPLFGQSGAFRGFASTESPHRRHKNYMEWKLVFENHSDLGWDYFEQIQIGSAQTAINWGSPCRFHDHGDIPSVKCEGVDKCPYPHGAPPTELRTQSASYEYPDEASVDVQSIGKDLQEKAKLVSEEQ